MKHFISILLLLLTYTGFSQVVINEIYPATNQVEIKNIGNDVINMLGGQIFDGGQGNVFFDNTVDTECGNFVLTPGEITVFTFSMNIDEASGQLMLNNSANTPVSFVQWGGVQSLATFAFSSGIWDDPTAFFEAVDSGNSIQLVAPNDRRDPSGYLQANPSICDENTACEITEVILRNLTCEDNGTPSDPTDDFFSFVAFADGNNLTGNVDLILSEGDLTPSSVPVACNNCVVESSIGTANGADYSLTVTANNGDCIFIQDFTAPESCSPECEIITSQVLNVTCNDNGTSTNPDDDYVEFLLTAWSFNGSDDGYFIVFPDGTEEGPYTYTNSHPINTQGLWAAGLGDFPIILEDADDMNCDRTITVLDPGSCSDACNITEVDITNVQCDDNGTGLDPTDDFLTFNIEVTGDNLSSEYLISSTDPELVISPERGSTLTLTTFTTNPGSAMGEEEHFYTIILEDATISNCSASETLVSPGSCSNDCILSFETFEINCNNNDTPADSSDDFYTLDLLITGTNVNDTYTAAIQPFEMDAQILMYNTLYQFSTPPGSADDLEGFGFTFFDTEEQCGGVTLNGTFDGPCSDGCEFTGIDISNVQCNDNGTSDNPTDDFLTFNVEVMGENLADEYRINSPQVDIMPATGSSLTISQFSTAPGINDLGDIDINITDFNDNCGISDILINPGSCSETCFLSIETLMITCQDGGTPEDSSDDFFQLDLEVSGTNTSASYTASIQPFAMNPQILLYDTPYQFSTAPGSASGLESFAITVTDAEQSCTGITVNGQFEYDCLVTSTNGLSVESQLRLFPNPANDQLHIQWLGVTQSPVSLQVFSTDGKLVQNYRLNTSSSHQLNISNWPSGVYMIRWQAGEEDGFSRIVKH
ncbi:MAG: T9SS type A sorting domain-containing protein [Bacteroidota bacterium]